MTTISLKLPVSLAARLESRARAHGKSKSALVRELIERGLEGTTRQARSFHDLAGDKCGIGRSGIPDLATHPRHLADYGQ